MGLYKGRKKLKAFYGQRIEGNYCKQSLQGHVKIAKCYVVLDVFEAFILLSH